MNTLENALTNPTRPTAIKKPKAKPLSTTIVRTAAIIKDPEPNVTIKETAQQKSARLSVARAKKAADAARVEKDNRIALARPYRKGMETTVQRNEPRTFEVVIRKDLNKPAEGTNLATYRVVPDPDSNNGTFHYQELGAKSGVGTLKTKHGVSFSRIRAALKNAVGIKR